MTVAVRATAQAVLSLSRLSLSRSTRAVVAGDGGRRNVVDTMSALPAKRQAQAEQVGEGEQHDLEVRTGLPPVVTGLVRNAGLGHPVAGREGADEELRRYRGVVAGNPGLDIFERGPGEDLKTAVHVAGRLAAEDEAGEPVPGSPHHAPLQRIRPRDAVTDREVRFGVLERRDQRSEARYVELVVGVAKPDQAVPGVKRRAETGPKRRAVALVLAVMHGLDVSG